MTDLLAMSSAIIDGAEGTANNRVNHELSVIRDDVAFVEAFSNCVLFSTDDGLLAFDTSSPAGGERVVQAIRGWKNDRLNTVVYTHGHVDHVGGCGAFVSDTQSRSEPAPRVVGHTNVAKRFDRYNLTNGYNLVINERQFGRSAKSGYSMEGEQDRFLPDDSPKPDVTYEQALTVDVGGLDVELQHAKGETDDHTWAWIPKHKAICSGDFFIWNFPNAGNPQKVQRYPREWAAAMREMADKEAELFLPAHGLPIEGKDRIYAVLTDVAYALETLVYDTLKMMNQGARLNDVIHSVKVAPEVLEKPYLAPMYDEPEFVVRNIWRLYGGWYDGNPAQLKPAEDARLGKEIAELAGGSLPLAQRGLELVSEDIRLACHLVELASLAEPDNVEVHAIRADVYLARRKTEVSLMAKGIFGHAAGESQRHLE